MMKAVGVTRYGGPEVLELIEVPQPRTGPTQIRIRVHAATVNPGDFVLRNGELDEVLKAGPLTPPYIPGMEAAGVVDEIGSEVTTDLLVGDKVMAIVMPIDATGGAYAEYLVLDPDQVTRMPVGATFAEAATLPMSGLTARRALDLLALDVPPESVGAAGDAITRHMTALAEELTDILRSGVLAPYRRGEHSPAEAERIERTLPQLRRLTLESVVAGFQRAANAVIPRSLARD